MSAENNYFSKFLATREHEQAAATASATERLARARSATDDQREHDQGILSIYRGRQKNHRGTSPTEVWGKEFGQLCNDLLEFARLRSSGLRTLLGARALTDGVWQTMAYPVAYSNPTRDVIPLGEYPSFQLASGQSVDISQEPVEPMKDVYLCEDGTLRRAEARPLEVVNVDGNVLTPMLGKWSISYSPKYEKRYLDDLHEEGNSWNAIVSATVGREFRDFKPSDVSAKMLLEDIAVQISEANK